MPRTTAQFTREFPNTDGLEKKAALLNEMLRNYEQVSANLEKMSQRRSDEEKAHIIDLLGAKEEVEAARNTIIASIASARGLLAQNELDTMVKQDLLTKTSSELINSLTRAKELNQLRTQSSLRTQHLERK